jgi:glutaredoxin
MTYTAPDIELRVYSKTSCPWCEKAKVWLDEKKIPYTVLVLDDHAMRNRLYDEMGLEGDERTVPQVVVTYLDGEWVHIGGYQDLIASRVETLWFTETENSRWR